MDFAFIVDPLPGLKAYKDSSVAMMREASSRGHAVYALTPGDISWDRGRVEAEVTRLELAADDHHWYREGARERRALARFDGVLMRKDPPFDMEYVYSTYLLEAAEREGARIWNRPRAIRDNNEKFAITRFASYTSPTLVTRDPVRLRAFVGEHHDVILKPLDGMGGTSIFRVRQDDPNLSVILETMNHFGERTVMAQRFIPEIADGDKRVLLIAGEPVPFSLARIPQRGETRGNLAAGGRGEARPLTARDREIATALGPALWSEGLLIVGLDIIGECLTEVNVTSPTCFVEITQQTGFNVPGMLVDALERHAPPH